MKKGLFQSLLSPVEPGSRRELRFLAVSFLCCTAAAGLDQYTKFFVEKHFLLHESLPVIPGFFSLTSVRNYGAAWSILSGYGGWLLAIAGLVVLAAIWYFRKLTDRAPERYLALFLIFGGIIGNSIDRLWRGAVVDFLDFHIGRYHWPVFNVADIAICTGVGLFLLSSLIREEKNKKTEKNGNF